MRFRRMMNAFVEKESAVMSLIDHSGLSEECKTLYKDHVRESIRALDYSHAESRNRKSINKDDPEA